VPKLQKEIKKRVAAYASAAALLALLLTVLCYNIGFQVATHPTPEPTSIPETSELKTFSSYEELKNFLSINMVWNSNSKFQSTFRIFDN